MYLYNYIIDIYTSVERTESNLEQHKIDRINHLAKKSKENGLTDEELLEQKALREEYIANFRRNLRGILDNTVIERPDGSRESLSKKPQKVTDTEV